MILSTLLILPNFVLVCLNLIPNKMRIWYKTILFCVIFTTGGFSINNCTFTIGNISLLNEDILAIYLDAFERNNLQSTIDFFTIQVNHENSGSTCNTTNHLTGTNFTLNYTLKICSPEIGFTSYETFYIGETSLDTISTNQFYSSSDFTLVSGPTILNNVQIEKLISYISQSGKLPNGKYLFQFDIENDSEKILDNKSESIEINSPNSLELLSPGGSSYELSSTNSYSSVPIFTWYSDYCGQCTFGIRLCEFNQDEHNSFQEALNDWSLVPFGQSNDYYEIPGNTLSLQYPAGHMDLEMGKHYVWQIRRSYETTLEPHHDYSPIYVFQVRPTTNKQSDYLDPYLSVIQSLIGKDNFDLWFSTGGELEQFVIASKFIYINGEEFPIDVLYSILSELNQGKIIIKSLQIQ